MATEEEQFNAAKKIEIQRQFMDDIPVGITTVEGLYQNKLAEQSDNSVLHVVVYGFDIGISSPVTLEEFREAISDDGITWLRPKFTDMEATDGD